MTDFILAAPMTATEGELYSFDVTPTAAVSGSMTIRWQIVPKGALPIVSSDFPSLTGMLSFASGAITAQTVSFMPTDDTRREISKDFELRIYDVGNNLLDTQAVTLSDNDADTEAYGNEFLTGDADANIIGLGTAHEVVANGSAGNDSYVISRFQYGNVEITDTVGTNLVKFDVGVTITDYDEESADGFIRVISRVDLTLSTGAVIRVINPVGKFVFQLGDDPIITTYDEFKTAFEVTGGAGGASGSGGASALATDIEVMTPTDVPDISGNSLPTQFSPSFGSANVDVFSSASTFSFSQNGSAGDDFYVISRFQYGNVEITDTVGTNLIKFDVGVTITDYDEESADGFVTVISRVALTLSTGAVVTIINPVGKFVFQLGDDDVIATYDEFKGEIRAEGSNATSALAANYTIPFPLPEPENTAPIIGEGEILAVNSAENQRTVTTLSATDDTPNGLNWSLTGGADMGSFSIDSTTGAITWNEAPDYETLNSRNAGNKTFSLTATVTDDDGAADNINLIVTLTDVFETNPSITQADGFVVESAEEQNAVTTLTATDTTPNGLTWSLDGADAWLFAINSATGAIRWTITPDYETFTSAASNKDFSLTATATDGGGLQDTINLTVRLTNIIENTAPSIATIIEPFTGRTNANVNGANGNDGVFHYTGTITQSGTGPIVEVSAGAQAYLPDASVVEIPAGMYTLTTPPASFVSFLWLEDDDGTWQLGSGDRPTSGTFYALGYYETLAGNFVAAGQSVTDARLAIETPTLALAVAENELAAVTSLAAIDVTPNGITWGLSGADEGLFTIASDGVISWNETPDFEATVSAANSKVFSLTVTATDDGELHDTIDLTITLTDVNEAPMIDTSGGTANSAENQRTVATLAAMDVDASDSFTWSLENSGDAALFAINSETGAITWVATPDFETTVSAANSNVFSLTAIVTDAAGLQDTVAVTVTLTDENDAPIIGQGDALLEIEAAENNQAVTTLVAMDADASSTLSWSLTGGADIASFVIDPMTGVITWATAPDFETTLSVAETKVFSLTATVTDDVGTTDTIDLSITLTPPTVIDRADTYTLLRADNGGAAADTLYASSSTGPRFIDGGARADIISGSVYGDVIVGGYGDDTIALGAGADTVIYRFDSSASGGWRAVDGGDVVTNFQRGIDKLLFVDTTGELIDFAEFLADISPNGHTQNGFPATPSDVISGVRLIFDNGNETQINGLFIDFNSAADDMGTQLGTPAGTSLRIDFAEPLDYVVNSQLVDEFANFGGTRAFLHSLGNNVNTASNTRIYLTDDIDSEATRPLYDFSKLPQLLGTAGSFAAIDPNAFQTVELADGRDLGLAPVAAAPLITGSLTILEDFTGHTNVEVNGRNENNGIFHHTATITATGTREATISEGAVAYLPDGRVVDIPSGTHAVTMTGTSVARIWLEQADDGTWQIGSGNLPPDGTFYGLGYYFLTFSGFLYNGDVATGQRIIIDVDTFEVESVENEQAVTTLSATGVGRLTWGLSGADAALFAIDSETGAVTWVALPDYDTLNSDDGDKVFEFTATVTDTNGLQDSISVAVTLMEFIVNTAPSITQGDDALEISLAENIETVTTLDVTDVTPNGLTWGLSGADEALFEISDGGVIMWATAPNYETLNSADGDKVFALTATVTDGAGLQDTIALAVTLTDVVETAPSIDTSGVTAVPDTVPTNVAPLASITTDVTEYTPNNADRATEARQQHHIANLTDGVTDDIDWSGPLLDGYHPLDADGKFLSFALDSSYVQGSVRLHNRDGASETIRIDNSILEFRLDGVVVGTATLQSSTQDSDRIITVTPAADLVFDEVRITFSGDRQNLEEIEILGRPISLVFESAENQQAVTTLTATDDTTSETNLRWSLSGADEALFEISDGGVVTWVAVPDYETLNSQAGNKMFELTATVTDDDGLQDAVDLTVILTDAPAITTPVIDRSLAAAVPDTTAINLAPMAIITTDVTEYTPNNVDRATEARQQHHLANLTDGVAGLTSAQWSGSMLEGYHPLDADGKFLSFRFENDDYTQGSVLLYNRDGGDEDRIDDSVLEFWLDGVAVGTPTVLDHTNQGANRIILVTPAADLVFDEVRIVFSGDRQNLEEIAIFGQRQARLEVESAENQQVVTTLAASDADGDSFTWSLTDGADAALFAIDSTTGAVTWVDAPDYETLDSAAGNKVFKVTATVTDDSGLQDSIGLTVTLTDEVGETASVGVPTSIRVGDGSAADILDVHDAPTGLLIQGGAGADTIIGTAHGDIIVGGFGDDSITLGTVGGADRIVYRWESGATPTATDGEDTITNFKRGEDQLILIDVDTASPITSLTDFNAYGLGADGLVTRETDLIKFNFIGVTPDNPNDETFSAGVTIVFATSSGLEHRLTVEFDEHVRAAELVEIFQASPNFIGLANALGATDMFESMIFDDDTTSLGFDII